MAVDMFLKIEGIEGESADATAAQNGSKAAHGKEIDVLSWSWGLSQSGSSHFGGGGGSGKVNVQDISITKRIDRSSPNLIQSCCTGEHFKLASLVMRKAGGKKGPVEYLTIKMNDVIVSSVTTGGSGGSDILTENVSLNFASFNITYQEQAQDGPPKGGEVKSGFSISQNKVVG